MKLVETSIINGDCEEIGTIMTVYNYEYGVGVTVEYQNTTDYDEDAYEMDFVDYIPGYEIL